MDLLKRPATRKLPEKMFTGCAWADVIYRGQEPSKARANAVRPGQFVIGSFFASGGTCANCRNGYPSSCLNRGSLGGCRGLRTGT